MLQCRVSSVVVELVAVASVAAEPSGIVGLNELGRLTKRKDSVFTSPPPRLPAPRFSLSNYTL